MKQLTQTQVTGSSSDGTRAPISSGNHQRRSSITWLLSGLLLAALACNVVTTKVGALQTDTHTIEPADATEVRVTVNMGVGELNLSGGAESLLQADFSYNVADWKPELDYQVTNNNGRLRVEQPSGNINGIPDDKITNRWTLRFNNEIPLDMNVTMGVGKSTLDFSELTLTDLQVKTGTGDITMKIGAQALDYAGIETGLGETNIQFGGGRLDDLNVKMGTGSVLIDLRGTWESNMNATIGGGLGDLTLKLPRDVGVRVRANTGLGDVKANGFRIQDDAYVNDAYGESDVTLDINIDTGVGTVILELGE